MTAWMQAGESSSEGDHGATAARNGDAYFAFVESMDEFGSFDEIPEPPDWLMQIRLARKQRGLPNPTWIVWLDCVRAGYFLDQITWRGEPCDINNREHAARRRERIASFENDKFRVAAVLLSNEFGSEARAAAQFAEASWHRITLGNRIPGIPAAMGEDFDLEVATREEIQIGHFGACPLDEHRDLLRVFNFNFIADAGREEEGGSQGPKGPPEGPKGWEKPRNWGTEIVNLPTYLQRL
jgi:hypothetical protein